MSTEIARLEARIDKILADRTAQNWVHKHMQAKLAAVGDVIVELEKENTVRSRRVAWSLHRAMEAEYRDG